MKKVKILSENECRKIYEEAKKRTAYSLNYAYDYIERNKSKEDTLYEAAMEKYKTDHENWLRRREESYNAWEKNEQFRKEFEEKSYKSKLAYWESKKKMLENQGKTIDESTRPEPKPFVPRKFTYCFSEPQPPIKNTFDNIDVSACKWIVMSFSNMYNNDQLDRLRDIIGGADFFELEENNYFRSELKKEKVITDENRKKIEYLILREHYIRLREGQDCDNKEAYSNDSKISGIYGEKLTIFELELMNMKNYSGKIVYDMYIPDESGNIYQIDIAYVSSIGIIVIESKNYSGTVTGDENRQKWTSEICDEYLFSGKKYRKKQEFYNPIKQNASHIRALQHHFKGIPCFSLVVFSERCVLNKINVSSQSGYVFNRYAMLNVFSRIFNNSTAVLNENMQTYIAEYLEKFCNPSDDIRKKHNDSIRDKVTHDYNNFESFDDYGDFKG